MSNPIKSLLPTPLSMNFISDINCLNQLAIPLFKFLIDSSLSLITHINTHDQSLIVGVLLRQKTHSSIISPSINSLKSIHTILLKVLKLMNTSEPDQIQANLQNCQKYLANVFSQNTLLSSDRISYFIQKLSLIVHKFLSSSPKTVLTSLGTVSWSIYSLKKTNLKNTQQNLSSSKGQSEELNSLKNMNKMYVKVSFGQNFSPSQIQKLIGSGFELNPDAMIEANIHQSGHQTKNAHQNSSRTVVMSLIDFRVQNFFIKLFMEQVQKLKNLNY